MRKLEIAVRPSRVRRYQSLLKTDWTLETLNESVDLLLLVLADSGLKLSFRWNSEKVIRQSDLLVSPEYLGDLREFMGKVHFEKTRIPNFPKNGGDLSSRLAEQVSALLSVQSLLSQHGMALIDKIGFLKSLQSLVFLQSAYDLMPNLSAGGLRSERQFLQQVMWLHALVVWKDDLSHLSYLIGVLGDCTGNTELRGDGYRGSFEMTASDEHDYLTTAQTYLYHLLDVGNTSEAREFALGLYRSSSADHMSEIKDLVDVAYEPLSVVR